MQKLQLILQIDSGAFPLVFLFFISCFLSGLWGCKPKKEAQEQVASSEEKLATSVQDTVDIKAMAERYLGPNVQFSYNASKTFVLAYTAQKNLNDQVRAFDRPGVRIFEVATGKSYMTREMIGAQMEWVSDTRLRIWQPGRIKGGSQVYFFDTETGKIEAAEGGKRYR